VTETARPVGSVTFMFTDIEGSTKLAQEFRGDRWNAILARHRELIRAALTGAGGHEEKTEGDGFLPAPVGRRAVAGRRRRSGSNGSSQR